MALPLVLFVVVYNMNPDYVSQLFTDPAGKKCWPSPCSCRSWARS